MRRTRRIRRDPRREQSDGNPGNHHHATRPGRTIAPQLAAPAPRLPRRGPCRGERDARRGIRRPRAVQDRSTNRFTTESGTRPDSPATPSPKYGASAFAHITALRNVSTTLIHHGFDTPGFPNKPAGVVQGSRFFGENPVRGSVLHRETPSFRCGYTPGESGLEAVQPSRVRGLRSGQGKALPPDQVAGGRPQDAVRSAAADSSGSVRISVCEACSVSPTIGRSIVCEG